MDQTRFTTLTRAVSDAFSRRHLLGRLGGAGLALGLAQLPDGAAAKKKRRKKRKVRSRERGCPAGRERCGKTCCAVGAACVNETCQRCDVCPSGCAFTTVQAAIDAADPGSAIRLCPGRYAGHVTVAKNLTLLGAGAERSFLDGGDEESPLAVLNVAKAVTVEARALTIRGGNSGDLGGGVANEGTLTLDGVGVTANRAKLNGGGIVNRVGATLTVTDSSVSGNKAGSQGGGLFIAGGDVTLSESQLETNEAGLTQAGQGGGIFMLAGALRLNGSQVTANKAGLQGGGLFILAGAMTLNESQVTGNKAMEEASEGGGLFISGGAVALNGTRVRSNTAAAGGGIYRSGGTITIESESVTGNTPDNCAGEPLGNCVN
jgi:hypothetical protein